MCKIVSSLKHIKHNYDTDQYMIRYLSIAISAYFLTGKRSIFLRAFVRFYPFTLHSSHLAQGQGEPGPLYALETILFLFLPFSLINITFYLPHFFSCVPKKGYTKVWRITNKEIFGQKKKMQNMTVQSKLVKRNKHLFFTFTFSWCDGLLQCSPFASSSLTQIKLHRLQK